MELRAEAFELVLEDEHAREQARLQRFRAWWLVRHGVVLVVAVAFVVSFGPGLVDGDSGDRWGLISWMLTGWVVPVIFAGLVGLSVLAIPFAIVRILKILRADDLAAFERRT